MKTIEGDLVLEKDTLIYEDLFVTGSVVGKEGNHYNLIIIGGDLICRRDIHCLNLQCNYLSCRDAICFGNIDCIGISYYGVCCAYNNIRCYEIKGKMPLSRHFAIGGKLIVDGKEVEE